MAAAAAAATNGEDADEDVSHDDDVEAVDRVHNANSASSCTETAS